MWVGFFMLFMSIYPQLLQLCLVHSRCLNEYVSSEGTNPAGEDVHGRRLGGILERRNGSGSLSVPCFS